MDDKKISITSTKGNRIFTLRSLQVMIDRDLAEMYGVETKVLNQAVKRNIERFPASFRFQITEVELNNLSRPRIVILNNDVKKGKNKSRAKYKIPSLCEEEIQIIEANKKLVQLFEAKIKNKIAQV